MVFLTKGNFFGKVELSLSLRYNWEKQINKKFRKLNQCSKPENYSHTAVDLNSPCRRSDSVRQARRSGSERGCRPAWKGTHDPSDPPSLWVGPKPAPGTATPSWWPSRPGNTSELLNSHFHGGKKALKKTPPKHSCSFYLCCKVSAGSLIAAPPGGEVDALGAQTLRVKSWNRCAGAAAAVHRLCLLTPADTHTTCHENTNYKDTAVTWYPRTYFFLTDKSIFSRRLQAVQI